CDMGTSRARRSALVDGAEQLFVGLGLADALEHPSERLLFAHLGEVAAQGGDLALLQLVEQRGLLAGAAGADVHGGEQAALRELAIEDQLKVAGALELLEDDLIHEAAGLDEGGGDDGEAADVFELAGGAEQLTGAIKGA